MRALALAVLVTLPGCAARDALRTGEEDGPEAAVDRALGLAVPDIEQALALARAAGDEAAIACYPALIEWVEGLQAYREGLDGGSAGVVTAYQRARNIRRAISTGAPARLEIACSALVGDSRRFLRGLILRLGL